MSQKKAIPLRIPAELWEELKGWAEQDLRSLNSQIEIILRDAVRERKSARKQPQRKAG